MCQMSDVCLHTLIIIVVYVKLGFWDNVSFLLYIIVWKVNIIYDKQLFVKIIFFHQLFFQKLKGDILNSLADPGWKVSFQAC